MRKLLPLLLFTQVVLNPQFISNTHGEQNRPNILFCISDDQSYAHTGANGDPVIQTPAFDRVAREGIRFTRAFCDAPTCGPSRSAILTGQPIWRLEEAGNIHSTLPSKFLTYTEPCSKMDTQLALQAKAGAPADWPRVDATPIQQAKNLGKRTSNRPIVACPIRITPLTLNYSLSS